ncbi:putative membrane protein [Paramicrosporidium saccamoebae]|uniref:Putative membrane protein n=1 Tax=Paramicrosporidium saccamoebae TaxID=1246581 RepID=A0A2H9TJY2_9FUNG|nr:putative membrane protein [Paramicrosporidium saccamoebae]
MELNLITVPKPSSVLSQPSPKNPNHPNNLSSPEIPHSLLYASVSVRKRKSQEYNKTPSVIHPQMILLGLLTLALGVFGLPLRHSNGSGEGLREKTGQAVVELVLGAGWYEFDFGVAGSVPTTSYHFVTTAQMALRVTDAFYAGDQFEVYDNGVLIGTTSSVPAVDTNYTPLPDAAWGSVGWSSFLEYLEPGEHLISFKVVASPHSSGDAFIRVDFGRIPY